MGVVVAVIVPRAFVECARIEKENKNQPKLKATTDQQPTKWATDHNNKVNGRKLGKDFVYSREVEEYRRRLRRFVGRGIHAIRLKKRIKVDVGVGGNGMGKRLLRMS